MNGHGTTEWSGAEEARRGSRLALLLWTFGGLVRLYAMLVYWPSHLQWADAPRYARIGYWSGVFNDHWAPAGYAAFLALLRVLSSDLGFTVACQHALGLWTAVLFAAAARRAGVAAPWYLIPGAIVAIGGDYVFLEHLLMPEALFLFLVAVGLFAGVRALEGDGRAWGVLAGLAFAGSALVRANALPLLAVLGVCAAPIPFRRGDAATRPLAWGVVCGALVVALYAAVATAVGPYSGLGDMTGWYLYSRAAPFADCERMTVDDESADMAALCESTPPSLRAGPYYYTWHEDGPARRRWHIDRGPDPAYDDIVAGFAVDAIRHQPLDYLRAVALDLVRAVAPGFRVHPASGLFMAGYSFTWRDEPTRERLEQVMSEKYTGTRVHRRDRGVELLAVYQEATRLPGGFLVVFLACALAGLVRTSGARRRQVLLALGTGLCLLVIPIASLTWDFRYTLPAVPVLALAAVLGCAHAPPGRPRLTCTSSASSDLRREGPVFPKAQKIDMSPSTMST